MKRYYFDIDRLISLRNYADMLASGIDPTTEIKFDEDTIMNHPKIVEFNCQMVQLLDSIINGSVDRISNKIALLPFYLSEESRLSFVFFDESVSISKLCYRLNSYTIKGMEKLRATVLIRGLINLGYLKEIRTVEGTIVKTPTEKGSLLGIVAERRCNTYGNEYNVNLYNFNAQRFIVDNLGEIISAGIR